MSYNTSFDKLNGRFSTSMGDGVVIRTADTYIKAEQTEGGVLITATDVSGTTTALLPVGPAGPEGPPGPTGATGPQGVSGVYIGGGDMPDGYNVQIDEDGIVYPTLPVPAAGDAGKVPVVNEAGNGYSLEEQSGGSGSQGADGFSPTVALTETAEGVEIAVTDKNGAKTATVYNGKDGPAGAQGPKGDTGPQGEQGPAGADGADGAQGPAGADGKDGLTPHIGANGNWFIGDEDTGVSAGGGGSTGGGGKYELLLDVTTEEEVTYIYQEFDSVSVARFLIFIDAVMPETLANTSLTGVYANLNINTANVGNQWTAGGISLPVVSSALLNATGAKRQTAYIVELDESGGGLCWNATTDNRNNAHVPTVISDDMSTIFNIRVCPQTWDNSLGAGTRVRIWGVKA